MRVEYLVGERDGRWVVTQGSRRLNDFEGQAPALTAAEHFARLTAERGETAVIKLAQADGVKEHRVFRPDLF